MSKQVTLTEHNVSMTIKNNFKNNFKNIQVIFIKYNINYLHFSRPVVAFYVYYV